MMFVGDATAFCTTQRGKKTTGLKKEFSPEPLFWSLNNCHDKLKVDPMDASRICKSSSAVVGHTGMCKTPINVGKFQFNIEVKKLKNYAYIGVASEKMSKNTQFVHRADRRKLGPLLER